MEILTSRVAYRAVFVRPLLFDGARLGAIANAISLAGDDVDRKTTHPIEAVCLQCHVADRAASRPGDAAIAKSCRVRYDRGLRPALTAPGPDRTLGTVPRRTERTTHAPARAIPAREFGPRRHARRCSTAPEPRISRRSASALPLPRRTPSTRCRPARRPRCSGVRRAWHSPGSSRNWRPAR